MATSTGALPSAPIGIGADPEAQKEYVEALNKQLKSLEDRQGFNLFNMAGAFLNPGRTGSFGEALGNAATSLGADLQRQEARELPIAQMRTQIAAQKYEMQNKEKAYGMVANAMGLGSAEDAARALTSGQGLVGLSTKFTPELYIALSRVDPKIAEYVKNAAGMDIERFKAINEAAKTNIDVTKLYQQFGKQAVDYFMNLNGGTLPKPTAPAPSGAPATTGTAKPQAAPAGQPQGRDPNLVYADDGTVIDVKAQPAPEDATTTTINGQPVTRPPKEGTGEGAATVPKETAPTAGPEFGYVQISPTQYRLKYSGRPVTVPEGAPPDRVNDILAKAIEAENDIYKKAIEAEAKPFEEKTADLLKFDNQSTAVNLNRVDKILELSQKYRKLPGALQQTDTLSQFGKWIAAVGAAAQEGIQAGKFGAFSIPIEKFVNTAILSQAQKEILGELSREISAEFLAGMKANRGLLGVNPTDNDARLFQAAAESPTSLSRNIYSWAQGRAAEYLSMNDIYKGYTQFRTQRGRGFDPASFYIDEKSPYHEGVRSYTERLLKVKQNAPGMQ
jgi:hypothetical protein